MSGKPFTSPFTSPSMSPSMSPDTSPHIRPLRICIVGGGPAGLLLAQLLQRANNKVAAPSCAAPDDSGRRSRATEVVVFEADASPTARADLGNDLDLQPDTGLLAIREAGLEASLKPHLRFGASVVCFSDSRGAVYYRAGGSTSRNPAPEVSRGALLSELRKGIDTIQWGSRVVGIRVEHGQQVVVRLSTGEDRGPFDLVIGADGARSSVRGAVTDAVPQYSGYTGFVGTIVDPDTRFPAISKAVGPGTHFVFRSGQKLTGHRSVDGNIAVAVVLRKPEGWASEVAARGAIGNAILSELDPAEWSGPFLQWVDVASGWKIYPQQELAGRTVWPQKPGVTLLGDAAHLLTTFGGKGVNIALVDALELANSIEAVLDGSSGLQRPQFLRRLNSAVRSYEESMFTRAHYTYVSTKRNQNGVSGRFAPVELLATVVTTKLLGSWAGNILAWWLLGTIVWFPALLCFTWRGMRVRLLRFREAKST
jgi:2-polyprenyl-6-methoxyphenol hydroxylase-like FAD-dependent oxidoreductase